MIFIVTPHCAWKPYGLEILHSPGYSVNTLMVRIATKETHCMTVDHEGFTPSMELSILFNVKAR